MGTILHRGHHKFHGETRRAFRYASAKPVELTHFRARRRHSAENEAGAVLGTAELSKITDREALANIVYMRIEFKRDSWPPIRNSANHFCGLKNRSDPVFTRIHPIRNSCATELQLNPQATR